VAGNPVSRRCIWKDDGLTKVHFELSRSRSIPMLILSEMPASSLVTELQPGQAVEPRSFLVSLEASVADGSIFFCFVLYRAAYTVSASCARLIRPAPASYAAA
jgi:hypothetical protein